MDIQWLTADLVIGLEATRATTPPEPAPAELLLEAELLPPPPHAAAPRRIKDAATIEADGLRDRLSMTRAA